MLYNRLIESGNTLNAHRKQIMTIKDSDSNELQAGAMYCCAFQRDDGENDYGILVRFIGYQNVCGEDYPVFADADNWEDLDECDYEFLVRQDTPIIDPATAGWGTFSFSEAMDRQLSGQYLPGE